MSSSGSASRPLLARPNSRKVNIAPAASTGLASASLSLYDDVASAGRLAEQEALSSSSGHSYGQGNRISDHSSSVAPDVSSQLHSEIPDTPFLSMYPLGVWITTSALLKETGVPPKRLLLGCTSERRVDQYLITPPSVPSADALRTPPPNPFQAIVQNYGDDSEDEEAGSEADEDLHLRNPFPPRDIYQRSIFAREAPSPSSASKPYRPRYKQRYTRDCLSRGTPAGDGQELRVFVGHVRYDYRCSVRVGVFDRYLDPLATVRFESPDSFAESFNAGERWKDPGLDWSPLQSAVVVCAEEVSFCTNESGTSAAMPPPLIVSERHTPVCL
ncbi:hypothetical protein R3P38DRAFT_3238255 [Favolaschia claudopus]|uniref:Uncharacterized protein n=1 Tax=Favolaschia claudopus TaxID=2862362 RepID=A0AAV9Z9V8_9AGAR